MPVNPRTDKYLHSKLPIDEDEKILAVFRHHWFAYVSSWIIGLLLVLLIMGVAIGFVMLGQDYTTVQQYRVPILAGASLLSGVILVGTALPVYLRSQEQLVLTEEALLQVLQPSLFASKISQLGLQHIADVSVRQDFFGTMLGYGHITIETPGEQDDYEFFMLPHPQTAARQIIDAHENFDAALQSGRIPTTFNGATSQTPYIDPEQYQEFLQYQKMLAEKRRQQVAAANDPTKEQDDTQQ